jgi:pimeloyl-ACP methyl ester carboxylesterase
MARLSALFALVLALTATSAAANPLDHVIREARRLEAQSFLPPQPAIPTLAFTQKLDHDSPDDTRVFKQNYWVYSTPGATKSSPVFYLLCGEAACSGSQATYYLQAHAQRVKGHIVALEHRYYGGSQPFSDLSTEHLQYLSTSQALADFAAFQRWVTTQQQWTGPWFVVGGSYSGSLAAYYRQKYPELAAGALASSGPVRALENFEEYDRHVALTVGPKCLAAIKKALAKVDAALDNPNAMNAIRVLYNAQDVKDPMDLVGLAADLIASEVQYGSHKTFCAYMETDRDPINTAGRFGRAMLSMYGVSAAGLTTQGAMNTELSAHSKSFGMRQWLYQVCTEYGYFQTAYHDANESARSALIDLDFAEGSCERAFGKPMRPDIEMINTTYYEPLLDSAMSSRVFFTNGSNDPWSNLSISGPNGNASNPEHEWMVIPKAAHCDDLAPESYSDSTELKQARARFDALVDQWMKP